MEPYESHWEIKENICKAKIIHLERRDTETLVLSCAMRN